MSLIKKPYDLLFRHTLSNDVAIKDFFRFHLPKKLLKRIDLNSIRPTKQSYVPPNLRELQSDLVCTCKIDGKEALIYVLVEHQSKAIWIMPLRLLKYKIALIEDYLSGKPAETPWPIVLSCCFYHGEESPYPYPTQVHSYFTDPSLAQELGIFTQFQLIDLTISADNELREHASLGLLERILKYSRDRDFLNSLSRLLDEYKDTLLSLESVLGDDYWYSVYLVSVQVCIRHGHREEEVASLFAEKLNISKTKEGIMGVTQELRQELRQEFLQEGIQLGIQTRNVAIAKSMLKDNEPKEKVIRWTGLDYRQVEKLFQELNY